MSHPYNKHQRVLLQKKQNEKIAMLSSFGYNPYIGWPKQTDSGMYIKYMSRYAQRAFCKSYANRIARRKEDAFPKGNLYRRQYNIWWELF